MTTKGNSFSYGKCWNFGKMMKEKYGWKWKELLERDDWKEFMAHFQFTDNQIFYIKRGYLGKPFEDEEPKEHPLENEIFPFGNFKGKQFKELSIKYLRWLNERDWLDKWPTVALYVRQRIEIEESKKLSPEEVKNILSL